MGERGRDEEEEPGRDRERKGRVSNAVTCGGICRQFTLQRYDTEGAKLRLRDCACLQKAGVFLSFWQRCFID